MNENKEINAIIITTTKALKFTSTIYKAFLVSHNCNKCGLRAIHSISLAISLGAIVYVCNN